MHIDAPGTQFFDFETPSNPLQPTTPLILPFRYGRVDALSCDDTGALPSADFGFADMQAFFGKFGLTINEIVAIMGGHSLGRCFMGNSGFDGGM